MSARKGGPGDDKTILQWQDRIRVLSNPVLWSNFFLGFGIPSLIMGVIFGLIGRPIDGLWLGVGCLLFFTILFVLIGLVADFFGGFHATFRLTDKGIRSLSGRGARRAVSAAIAGGVLARSLSVMGAGLSAKTEQEVFIPWREIKKVSVRTKGRFVLVKGSFGQKPIGLYCTPENFEEALRTIREKSPSAAYKEK